MTDVLYLLACGIVWNKTRCEAARQEVVRALRSRDPDLRCAAELVLARSARLQDCIRPALRLRKRRTERVLALAQNCRKTDHCYRVLWFPGTALALNWR